jgi:hypothetical protein
MRPRSALREILLGLRAGATRLPIVDATAEETAVVRAMLVRHGLLTGARA